MTQTPNIKKGDSVKLPDGTIHEISSIQYVHDRYQLLGVSNWKYGINDLVLTRPQAAYFYWLQEAKELQEIASGRGRECLNIQELLKAVESREQRLKETLERIAEATEDIYTEDAARHTLSTLYPDTQGVVHDDRHPDTPAKEDEHE
jgi:hypothetical protein